MIATKMPMPPNSIFMSHTRPVKPSTQTHCMVSSVALAALRSLGSQPPNSPHASKTAGHGEHSVGLMRRQPTGQVKTAVALGLEP